MRELTITLTPRPDKNELIIGLQMGDQGRLILAQVKNLPKKPVVIKGGGPEFVHRVENELKSYMPKSKLITQQILNLARKANPEKCGGD